MAPLAPAPTPGNGSTMRRAVTPGATRVPWEGHKGAMGGPKGAKRCQPGPRRPGGRPFAYERKRNWSLL